MNDGPEITLNYAQAVEFLRWRYRERYAGREDQPSAQLGHLTGHWIMLTREATKQLHDEGLLFTRRLSTAPDALRRMYYDPLGQHGLRYVED